MDNVKNLNSAVEVAAACASTASTAQQAAERAAEECKSMMEKIRSYEGRRPIVKEVLREIESAVNLRPIEDRLTALEQRPGQAVTVLPDTARLDKLAAEIASVRDALARVPAPLPPTGGEVLAPAVSNILDRMEALEQLVVDSMDLPQALANQLRLTSEIMEVHREASERAAAAQGGLATVVESMRVDMEALTQAVAHLRGKIENRESYAAGLLGRRRAG